MEEATLASPYFIVSLRSLETEGLLDFQGGLGSLPLCSAEVDGFRHDEIPFAADLLPRYPARQACFGPYVACL